MRDADIIRKHRNLIYVQALKFVQTGGGSGGKHASGRASRRERKVPMQATVVQARGARSESPSEVHARAMPATDDEIQEKYLERAIRELNQLTHELQECRSVRAAT